MKRISITQDLKDHNWTTDPLDEGNFPEFRVVFDIGATDWWCVVHFILAIDFCATTIIILRGSNAKTGWYELFK